MHGYTYYLSKIIIYLYLVIRIMQHFQAIVNVKISEVGLVKCEVGLVKSDL